MRPLYQDKIFREMKKKYSCPRCNGNNVVEYDESIDCVDCKLEFHKYEIDTIEDKSTILSIQEKMAILDEFK